MNTNEQTSHEKLVAQLQLREHGHLRQAYRATRAALDAQFFGDTDSAYLHLEEAHSEKHAASVCHAEVEDLLRVATDSSAHDAIAQ